MVDRQYSLSRTKLTTETLDETEFQNILSEHAVSDAAKTPETAEGGTRNSSAPISQLNIRRQSLSRHSLHWTDILAGRRASAGVSSLVSSLTLTDFGDSFYTDHISQTNFSRWDEDELEEYGNDGDMCPCDSHCPCDHKPILPNRRDSISTGKISARPRVHDIACGQEHNGSHDHNHPAKDHPIQKETRTSFQDRHPIRPGRRESAVTADEELLTPPDKSPLSTHSKRNSC